MFSKFDMSRSVAKNTAKKFLSKKEIKSNKSDVDLLRQKKIISSDLKQFLSEDEKLHICKAYDEFLGVYQKNKKRTPNPAEIEDFNKALEEYLLESIISEIERESSNRPDEKLIKEIIKKLLAKSFLKNDFEILARIKCAKELLDYVTTVELVNNEPISYTIKKKYPLIFERFSKEFKDYNDPLVRKKLEDITDISFDEDDDLPTTSMINKFVYDKYASQLFYYDFDGKKREIDIKNLDLEQIKSAINDKNLIKLQNLLKKQFPKKLKLAKLALQESSKVSYFKAKLGAFTNFGGNNKSKGTKNREKAHREAAIYDSSLSERLDMLKAVTNICNQKADEFGFYDDKKVVFKLCLSYKLDFASIASDDKDFLVLHINNKNEISLQFISKRLGASVNVSAEDNFLRDLAYISTNKLDNSFKTEKYKPDSKVLNFRKIYRNPGENITKEVDDEDFIKYIVENTGFVAPSVLENHYQTIAEISDMVSEHKQISANLPEQYKQVYTSILDSIEKISELPVNRLKNSDSLIPRYKCKTILKKLALFAQNYNDLNEREYIRNSYKIYQGSIDNENHLKSGGVNNPRFYFNPKTDEIAYVDANNRVFKSKFLPQYRSKIFDDSGVNFAKLKPQVDPDKLINLLKGKEKNNDNSVTLDSEEVFKYISMRVEDKNQFKMHTLNEELEEILADEVRTTSFAFRKIAIAAAYVTLMMILLFVPGFNLLLYGIAIAILNLTPFFIDSVAMGAYNDALKNVGIAIAMSTITILILFIPGANFIAPATTAMWMVYLTLAIASATTAYNLTSTMNAASKNPSFSEGKRELLSLVDNIKSLSKDVDDAKNTNIDEGNPTSQFIGNAI